MCGFLADRGAQRAGVPGLSVQHGRLPRRWWWDGLEKPPAGFAPGGGGAPVKVGFLLVKVRDAAFGAGGGAFGRFWSAFCQTSQEKPEMEMRREKI